MPAALQGSPVIPPAGRTDAPERPALEPRSMLLSLRRLIYDWDIASDRIIWSDSPQRLLPGLEAGQFESEAAFERLILPRSGISRSLFLSGRNGNARGESLDYTLRYALRLGPDRLQWIEDTGRCFAGVDGRPALAHGLVRLVDPYPDERPAAKHDPLTGCLTLARFSRLVDKFLPRIGAGEAGAACVAIRLRALAETNRLAGFEAGDAMLVDAARRLRRSLRRGDLICREADTFYLALFPCSREALEPLLDRFRRCIAAREQDPWSDLLRNRGSASGPAAQVVGLSLVDSSRSAARIRLALGDLLDPPRRRAASVLQDGQSIEERLLAALNARTMTLALAPALTPEGRSTAFHSAALRLATDGRGPLSLRALAGSAETGHLLPMLSARLIALTHAVLAANRRANLAIELDPQSLAGEDCVDQLLALAAAAPDAARRLIVAVRAGPAPGAAALASTIRRLRSAGMRIMLDGFGAGGAPFRQWLEAGIDLLRIDGALVQNLRRSPDDRFVVRALIDLAREARVPVAAEWVDDADTAALLAGWGISYLQGRHLRSASPSSAHPAVAPPLRLLRA